MPKTTKIVIVGASFGGRMIATNLLSFNKAKHDHIEIIMVDKSEHFEFNFTFYKNLFEDQWT
jgi:NADH dehydrogenase FAD-containing subunit